MTDHTYWISIGRNVGADPLPDSAWERFQVDVAKVVSGADGSILATVYGESAWEQIPEDTVLILAAIPASAVGWIRSELSHIAKAYYQEAIGFVGGPGESLIYAN